MDKSLTKFVYLVNVVFTILCLLHIIINFHVTLYPPNPDIKVYDKELKDVVFPILFKLCGKEIYNTSEKFRKLGYRNEIPFFIGRSQHSKNVIGWNGHTENRSTIGSVSGKLSSHSLSQSPQPPFQQTPGRRIKSYLALSRSDTALYGGRI